MVIFLVMSVVAKFDEVNPGGCNSSCEEFVPANVRLSLKCLFQCVIVVIGDMWGYIWEV